MSYGQYDAADENDDLLDLAGAECKPPISLKQTEFSLKQFPKGWARPSSVHPTSGGKYGWGSFLRRSIGAVSGGNTY
jgi:hypothetical protein